MICTKGKKKVSVDSYVLFKLKDKFQYYDESLLGMFGIKTIAESCLSNHRIMD